MDVILPLLLQLLYIAIAVAAVMVLFALAAVLRIYVQKKMGMDVTYNWNEILLFSVKAVQAVQQTHAVRPEGLTDEEWNHQRYAAAEDMVISYAKSIGIEVDKDFLRAIRAAIESAVLEQRKKNKGLTITKTVDGGGKISVGSSITTVTGSTHPILTNTQ